MSPDAPPLAAESPDATRDRVFDDPAPVGDFRFDRKVVAVFDDMVGRSVPFYHEMQRMTAELAADFGVEGTSLYDLGCSTGTTLLAMDKLVTPGVRFVGVDAAEDMLDKARQKVAADGTGRPIEFRRADLHRDAVVEGASVATMILTLQFMRPLYRERVVKRIADGLRPQGAFILIEKLTVGDSMLNRLFIRHYHEYKARQGYSEMEISQKREALENVLIPYRLEENVDLLRECGLRHVEVFFRWYNFCGIVGVK